MTIPRSDRVPILYLAPWVDYGGSDKGTIDWFRWLDRDRFAPILATTQPSENRRLREIYPFAEEVWPLPDFLAGQDLPPFIFDLIHTRGIRVLHVMNSRIGFDLLPDLGALPMPPAVVVQLHVEEADKSGYVRYVTTRYGNLVDAFSVSSKHLADAVASYEVPRDKIHVIPTGVDAESEFNPDRVTAVESLDPSDFNVLYPGRLTEQKDPLLMIEVIRRLAPAHERLRVHVVGDGPLEPEVRAAVGESALASHVRFHQPSGELARWYAASDVLLMTSVFEGVPYVLYEAMAMGLPVVAPALAGNVELMGDTAGVLIDPRDDVSAYVGALHGMIADGERRATLGRAGRNRVLEKFSVRSMGHLHGELYDALLEAKHRRVTSDGASAPVQAPQTREPSRDPPPLRFTNRPPFAKPLVSIVMPCFNHGHFLKASLAAVLAQRYPAFEVIVVDDGSTDRETPKVLAELEQRDRVRVIRQSVNSGPSAARNRAIAAASGRYILPVDSDNLLLPGAIDSLVTQLQSAGERIGYVYPNLQYFGTRDDYFQPPSYNLALLLDGNYCDSCSLIDRDVFDAGLAYAEDIRLGHEDWDFVLSLAERGVRGEPAREQTLLYRKHGFTRSDAVEYSRNPFRSHVQARHPRLYGGEEALGRCWRWTGPAAQIKGGEAPSVSLVMTAPVDIGSEAGLRLLRRLDRQSCRDLELIIEYSSPPEHRDIRRIPPGLCSGPAQRLQEGLGMARAPMTMIAGAELIEMLAEPGFVEKLHRTFRANRQLGAIAFTDAGESGRFAYRLLSSTDIRAPAHALVWLDAAAQLPRALQVDEGLAVESLARVLSAHGISLQWRHFPAGTSQRPGAGSHVWTTLPVHRDDSDPHRRAERRMSAELPPALPSLPSDAIRRWLGLPTWIPAESTLLTRHRNAAGERRVLVGRASPPGFVLEYDLGVIRCFAPPGTTRLVQGSRGIRTAPRGSPREDGDEELGHLELAPLPLLELLERAVLEDGSETLVAGERDPLRSSAVNLDPLGFIEAYPSNPPFAPDARHTEHGIVGLVRCVDRERQQHVYSAGTSDYSASTTGAPELVGELGALHLVAEPGSIAAWIDSQGRLVTTHYRPPAPNATPRRVLRWVLAPASWRGFGHVRGRARSIARRSLDALRGRSPSTQAGAGAVSSDGSCARDVRQPIGFLYPEGGRGRHELFAATHPVTSDQLLTLYRLEAADMGYEQVVSLGFLLARAPVTGTLALKRVSVPWASRFGLEVRRR